MTSIGGKGLLTIDERKIRIIRGPAWTRTDDTRGEGEDRQRRFTAVVDGQSLEVWDPDPEQENDQ